VFLAEQRLNQRQLRAKPLLDKQLEGWIEDATPHDALAEVFVYTTLPMVSPDLLRG